MARPLAPLLLALLLVVPACRAGGGGAAPSPRSSPPGEGAEEADLPPLYGDLVSSSSPSTAVSYRTSYMPPIAELDPAEREAVTRAIHARLDAIQRCVDALALEGRAPDWEGTVRVGSPTGGAPPLEVVGRGDDGAEQCVREAAARWELLPVELLAERAVEIPIRIDRAP